MARRTATSANSGLEAALPKAFGYTRADDPHAELYRFTAPAVERFEVLRAEDEEAAEGFRAALRDYVRKYGFLAQVVGFSARELERLYVYGKMLLNRLPRRADPGVDLGQVDLTHLRIAKTGEQDVSLAPEGEQMLPGFTGDGAGAQNEPPSSTPNSRA